MVVAVTCNLGRVIGRIALMVDHPQRLRLLTRTRASKLKHSIV
ncbi:MAG: hypothetical protein ACI8PT_000449 [Gammaproteobacteria bacterium]|jgi:hypothetical protein